MGWNEKNFGWRIDPFTGQKAMHEGTDFMADMRTPVHAAASGVVVVAQRHPQYGNMIDIDHGNGFTTRYAHLSKLMVKPGDVVRRGAIIGLSGSTGRSTGPHLHFEVRYKGVAQNPSRFLRVSAASLAKN
jgi:murein DD-endopeptidase MepM/ murein hydrolase activator NlpD